MIHQDTHHNKPREYKYDRRYMNAKGNPLIAHICKILFNKWFYTEINDNQKQKNTDTLHEHDWSAFSYHMNNIMREHWYVLQDMP